MNSQANSNLNPGATTRATLRENTTDDLAPFIKPPVLQFEIGSMRNFVYLIILGNSQNGEPGARPDVLPNNLGEAIVIDPQKDLRPLQSACAQYGVKITEIWLTHSHHDHIAGVPALLDADPSIRLRAHQKDAHRLPEAAKKRLTIWNFGAPSSEVGDPHGGCLEFKMGDLNIQVIHTPGHSAGAVSYLVSQAQSQAQSQTQSQAQPQTQSQAQPNDSPPESYLISGDTLFIRDCGRTDLETGSNEDMFKSLQTYKKLTPINAVLLPGHHYARECFSQFSDELKASPPLLCNNIEELQNLP